MLMSATQRVLDLECRAAFSEGACEGVSTASDAAVVMVSFVGEVADEKRTAGDSGACGASALITLRLRVGCLARGPWASEIPKEVQSFLGKSPA
jgi:hypothetical protein